MGRFKIGRDLGPIYRVNLLGDENVVLNKPKYAEVRKQTFFISNQNQKFQAQFYFQILF